MKPLKSFLVDLPAGAMRGMRQEQEGFAEVHAEITGNQPKYGDSAGITATDFARFTALHTQHDQIAAQIPVAEKAHEVLVESLAYVDDARHKLIMQFADAVEAHAKGEGGDPTLRTAYEKTIAYRSAAGRRRLPCLAALRAHGGLHHGGVLHHRAALHAGDEHAPAARSQAAGPAADEAQLHPAHPDHHHGAYASPSTPTAGLSAE